MHSTTRSFPEQRSKKSISHGSFGPALKSWIGQDFFDGVSLNSDLHTCGGEAVLMNLMKVNDIGTN